jgi:hypothetical protein
MTFRKWLWLLPLGFILSACPYESTVPLTKGPSEPIDSTLLGYWYGIVKDGSDFFGIEALDISKKTDSLYSITRYGKAVKGDIILPDTSYFTGFITYIGDQRYMNVEGSVTITESYNRKSVAKQVKVYYLSAIENRNDTLSIKTITEDFTARKSFNSPEELKLVVAAMTQEQKNIFDDLYSLSYRKIPKPPTR